MKILKHGNKVNKSHIFTCKTCGCVFQMSHEEFTKNLYLDAEFPSLRIKGKEFMYWCPECKSIIRKYYNI